LADVNILIKGIAICYFRNNVWTVLFPFNKDHRVKLVSPKFSGGKELGFPGESVQIRAVGAGASHAVEPPASFTDFIDLTGGYAHQRVKPLADWPKHGVYLTIENATFEKLDNTYCRYLVTDSHGVEKKAPIEIGYAATLNLSSIVVQANGQETFTHTLTGNTNLTFDNTCPGRIAEDDADFNMVCSLIEGADGTHRQFKMKRDPAQAFVPPIDLLPDFLSVGQQLEFDQLRAEIGELRSEINALKTQIGGTDANLDLSAMAFDNPVKFQAGLPCNITVVTDPTNLP
jgi:hypothetical protein